MGSRFERTALCRIVLADDHAGLLREIRALLARNFEILEAVADGQALIAAVRRSRPDVVISDIRMPLMSGIEACGCAIGEGLCAAAILLTMHNDEQLVKLALRAGIQGYVLKMDAAEELVPAVNSVLSGGTYLSRGVLRSFSAARRPYL